MLIKKTVYVMRGIKSTLRHLVRQKTSFRVRHLARSSNCSRCNHRDPRSEHGILECLSLDHGMKPLPLHPQMTNCTIEGNFFLWISFRIRYKINEDNLHFQIILHSFFVCGTEILLI
jgi:hypothetical protein